MDFRRATPRDAAGLAKVHVDSWHAAYREMLPESAVKGFTREWRTEGFRESIAAESEDTYVAEEHGEIVGFLTLGACRDSDLDPRTTGEIWGIYVASNHWRRGIGAYLCRHGESMLAARGYTEAVLWVFDANVQARRFYEAMGFEAHGASKEVNWGVPLKAVRYRKTLEGGEPPPSPECR